MPMPTMRALVAGLGEVCQPASLLPVTFRAGAPLPYSFSQQWASCGEPPQLAHAAWVSGPCCSAVRQYPAALAALLELNLRLGQEVLEARRQRLEARSEAEKFSEELSQVRQSLTFDVPTETPTEPCLLGGVVPPPGLLWPLIESSPAAVEGMSVGQKCACHGVLASWGCEEHQVYTDRLLLAHRDKSLDVARGPPGLERPLAASEHMLVAKDVTYALRAPRRRRTWVKPSRCVD